MSEQAIEYRYIAAKANGTTVTGTTRARDERSALANLAATGLTVVELAPAAQKRPWYLRDVQLGRGGLSDTDVADLSETLSLLLDTGLGLPDALSTLNSISSSERARAVCQIMSDALSEGRSPAEALDQLTFKVPPQFRRIVDLGLKTNQLSLVLREASHYFRNRAAVASKVRAALLYPAILIIAAILLLVFLAYVLVPSLMPLLNELDAPVPWLIASLAWASERPIGVTVAGLILFASAIALVRGAMTGALPLSSIRLGRRGGLTIDRRSAALARELRLMLLAGERLQDALAEMSRSSDNSEVQELLRAAAGSLQGGQPASKELAHDPRLSPAFRKLFELGETSNTLERTMESAANVLEARANARQDRLLTLLTPLLTMIVGGLIALLVYQVMGAVLAISDVPV